ncbi:MAG: hypothetical protein JO142_08880 [Burkholderiales bacterium]|nr:hypothetical protein [Burkholderiales bacterium]
MNLTTYYDVFNSGKGISVPSVRLGAYIANIGASTDIGPGQFTTDGRVRISTQGQLKSAVADLQANTTQVAKAVTPAKDTTGTQAARGSKDADQTAAETAAAGAVVPATPSVVNAAALKPEQTNLTAQQAPSGASKVIAQNHAETQARLDAGTKASLNQRANVRDANLLAGARQVTADVGRTEVERATAASSETVGQAGSGTGALRLAHTTPANHVAPLATAAQSDLPPGAGEAAGSVAAIRAANETPSAPTTETTASVTPPSSSNAAQLTQSAVSLVQAVNHFVDQAQALAKTEPHNPAVANVLKSVTQVFAPNTSANNNTVSQLGLTQGTDGRITVDQARLQTAVTANPTNAQNILTQAVNQVGQAANNALINPQRQSDTATRAGFSNGENPYIARPAANASIQPATSVVPVPSTTLLNYTPTTQNLYGLGQYLAVAGL